MIDLTSLLAGENLIFCCGLLLPAEQEVEAIKLNNLLASDIKNRVKFRYSQSVHPPYVRLYETILPTKNVQTAGQYLEQLSQHQPKLTMTWGAIERTDHFVAIWGENNNNLDTFHKAVLKNINILREGLFKEKYIEDENEHFFSAEEDLSFQTWGSPWAEPYVPHMVIAKGEPSLKGERTQISWDYKDCQFIGILVGARSDRGDFSHITRVKFEG